MGIRTVRNLVTVTLVFTFGFLSGSYAANADAKTSPAGSRGTAATEKQVAKPLDAAGVVVSDRGKRAAGAARSRKFLPEPGGPDTIRIVSIGSVKPGASFGLDVRISNDETLSAISLPLLVSPKTLTFDSATFATGMARHVDINLTNTNQYEKTGRLLFASLRMMGGLMQPGQDTLYCRLFFTVPVDAKPHVVTITPTSFPPSNSLLLTSPDDDLGFGIVPEFIVGRIGVGMALPAE